jgi:hypothetical protein
MSNDIIEGLELAIAEHVGELSFAKGNLLVLSTDIESYS